ncbi:MAG: protein kinase [Planctomycetes bacterium]|nr:protein kinase [Planctomycetota bacterium]
MPTDSEAETRALEGHQGETATDPPSVHELKTDDGGGRSLERPPLGSSAGRRGGRGGRGGVPEIPGYRDISPLGSGSFADVFSAEDESVSRRVAIKVLRAQAPTVAQLDRFRRERETLATLNHPHVLRVHAAGSIRGRPYVVTELLPGRTLDDFLQEVHASQSGDRAQLLDFVHQAALGVAALHSVGLVHRDVKPENLLVDEEGKIKVADLGLVSGADLRSLTAEGVLVGTPAYVAPELCRATGSRDPTCDVYSLGATLYEVLTGEIPNLAPNVTALLLKRMETPNPDPRQVAPDVPAALAELCQRAMELEPEDRYPDAGAFAEALVAARFGSRDLKDRRVLRILIATLVLALAALGSLPWLLPPPGPALASPSPSPLLLSPSPPRPAATPAELVARLLARSSHAEGQAGSWIVANPTRTETADRLREAARLGRLLGPPTWSRTRSVENAVHRPVARLLPGEGVLWTELCGTWCHLEHSNRQTAVVRLSRDGPAKSLNWPGHHVTAVGSEGVFWSGSDERGASFVYRLEGTRFTLFARNPVRSHGILADADGVASGLDDGRLIFRDAKTGAVVWERKVHAGAVCGIVWHNGALASFSRNETTPVALLSRETGEALPWGFTLPPLGTLRWGIKVVEPEEIVLALRTNVVHGLRPQAANRTFAGLRVFNTQRAMHMGGTWSPDGASPRGAASFGSLLVTVGSQRIAGMTQSELRVFDLRSGREIASKVDLGSDYTSVTYSASEESLLIAGLRGTKGVLQEWDLDLGGLAGRDE